MHLGLLLECDYRSGATQQEALDDTFRLCELAERGGLDELWLAERHFASPERASSGASGGLPSFASAPLVLATALAARTSRIRIGTAVSLLPLVHPIRLAEEVATLDQISRGRLDLGVGRSGFLTAYQGYGISYDESRERFEECLAVLHASWTRDSFSFSGRHYNFQDVSVFPKPFQSPHPPIRIAATTAETFPGVGSRGFPIFAGLRTSDVPEVASQLASYRDAWHQAGQAGQPDALVRIPVYVAETAAAAYEEPRESTLASYQRLSDGYRRSLDSAPSDERAARAERLSGLSYDAVLRNRVAYGTPASVIQRLREVRDELDASGFIIEANVGGRIARDQVERSVQLFCEQVAPHL